MKIHKGGRKALSLLLSLAVLGSLIAWAADRFGPLAALLGGLLPVIWLPIDFVVDILEDELRTHTERPEKPEKPSE